MVSSPVKKTRGVRTITRIGPWNFLIGILLIGCIALFVYPKGEPVFRDTIDLIRSYWPLIGALAVIATAFTVMIDSRWLLAQEQMRYLAAEIWNEAGPSLNDYREAFRQYRDLLKEYDSAIGSRRFLSSKNPGGSPSWSESRLREDIRRIESELKQASHEVESVESARKLTHDFAERITLLTEDFSERYSIKHWQFASFFWRGKVPMSQVELAIGNFIAAVSTLLAEPSYENAKQACLLSRTAGARVHGYWPEIKGDHSAANLLLAFARNLNQALAQIGDIEGMPLKLSEVEARALAMYKKSMDRRRQALEGLRANDPAGVQNILRKAIADAQQECVTKE